MLSAKRTEVYDAAKLIRIFAGQIITAVVKVSHTAAATVDIDECRDSHGGCEHECVNSQGSYQCVCHEGYTLRSDRRTCEASTSYQLVVLRVVPIVNK